MPREEKNSTGVCVDVTKSFGDEIFVPRGHSRAALAAAPLRTIGGQRHALDVALVRNGDDAVLALNEVFVLHLAFEIHDLRLARRGELDRGWFSAHP